MVVGWWDGLVFLGYGLLSGCRLWFLGRIFIVIGLVECWECWDCLIVLL